MGGPGSGRRPGSGSSRGKGATKRSTGKIVRYGKGKGGFSALEHNNASVGAIVKTSKNRYAKFSFTKRKR